MKAHELPAALSGIVSLADLETALVKKLARFEVLSNAWPKPMPTADIAANAKGYTVLIECWR